MDADENAFLELMRDKLTGSFHILDVGAARGNYTLAAQALFPEATFHAFEPTPDHFKLCQENLSDVILNNVVVGAKDEDRVSFNVIPDNQEFSYIDTIVPSDGVAHNMPMVSLHSYISKLNGVIGLVKIDTEGYEFQCLDGLGPSIDRVKFVQVEYGGTWGREERLTGRSIHDLLRFMESNGFRVLVYDNAEVKQIPSNAFIADEVMRNILFERP